MSDVMRWDFHNMTTEELVADAQFTVNRYELIMKEIARKSGFVEDPSEDNDEYASAELRELLEEMVNGN